MTAGRVDRALALDPDLGPEARAGQLSDVLLERARRLAVDRQGFGLPAAG